MTLTNRTGRFALRAAAVGAAVIGFTLGATAVPAAAAGETVGRHSAADVDCNLYDGNDISVAAPDIWAVPVYRPGWAITGPTHNQWVRYQAMLWTWDANRSLWTGSTTGPWK